MNIDMLSSSETEKDGRVARQFTNSVPPDYELDKIKGDSELSYPVHQSPECFLSVM